MLRYSMEAKWTRVCCGVQYWAPVELLTPPQLLSMLHCIISSWPLAHLIERPRLGHDEEETMTNAICLSELLGDVTSMILGLTFGCAELRVPARERAVSGH